MERVKTYTEKQVENAKLYFLAKDGTIISDGEKTDGLYRFLVKIKGINHSFRIYANHLWWLKHEGGHWDWKRVLFLEDRVKPSKKSYLKDMKTAVNSK